MQQVVPRMRQGMLSSSFHAASCWQLLPSKLLLPTHLHSSSSIATRPLSSSNYAKAAASSAPSTDSKDKEDALRLVYEPPSKRLSFRTWHQRRLQARSDKPKTKVDVLMEGQPLSGIISRSALPSLADEVSQDANLVISHALALKAQRQLGYKLPRVAVLSLVLCDDAHISRLNAQHRGKQGPTDVLSFEMDDELDFKVSLPVKLIGDIVISLDTAQRQADERGHSLRDELRVLLVHGMLHLCGYDHENGDKELLEMAAAESVVMQQLGWEGQGLIAAVGAHSIPDMHDQPAATMVPSTAPPQQQADDQQQVGVSGFRKRPPVRPAGDSGSLGVLGAVFGAAATSSEEAPKHAQGDKGTVESSSSSSSSAGASTLASGKRRRARSDVRLVALDMDGTLLDSKSRIRPSSVQAIKAACRHGVQVILATGKARPAALRACRTVGLEGPNLLVHSTSPGIFLQGLAVHGRGGQQLADAQLPKHVVEQAFRYLQEQHPDGSVSLVAFTGDHCVTLRMTDDVKALHDVYYEPLASVAPSLKAILSGPPVRKMLFMTAPKVVDGILKPHWLHALQGSGAAPMQAVSNMLEIVPEGVDKWVGAQLLLKHLDINRDSFMAVGDGSNDLQMVANAGIGVAMGNAVAAVRTAAKAVVSSNDEDGIAEAFERFVL